MQNMDKEIKNEKESINSSVKSSNINVESTDLSSNKIDINININQNTNVTKEINNIPVITQKVLYFNKKGKY